MFEAEVQSLTFFPHTRLETNCHHVRQLHPRSTRIIALILQTPKQLHLQQPLSLFKVIAYQVKNPQNMPPDPHQHGQMPSRSCLTNHLPKDPCGTCFAKRKHSHLNCRRTSKALCVHPVSVVLCADQRRILAANRGFKSCSCAGKVL